MVMVMMMMMMLMVVVMMMMMMMMVMMMVVMMMLLMMMDWVRLAMEKAREDAYEQEGGQGVVEQALAETHEA
eukprot:4013707-Pyramimonas_sp.AAC.1